MGNADSTGHNKHSTDTINGFAWSEASRLSFTLWKSCCVVEENGSSDDLN